MLYFEYESMNPWRETHPRKKQNRKKFTKKGANNSRARFALADGMGIFDKDFVKAVYGKGVHEEKDPDLFYAKTPLGYYHG